MRTICFIVPYFGKLPSYYQMWLDTCKLNETVHWLVFTDDRTEYIYPANVNVIYMSFAQMQDRIRSHYDFDICINTPYKLCDYKIAYGEIFSEYLVDYDFWGFCDIDLMWGDIRKFYTENILAKYDKVGNQGHCMLFRNSPEVNSRYRTVLEDASYIEHFAREEVMCTDVVLIRKIYDHLNLPAYTETIYAGLEKYEPGFYLQAKPKSEGWKNYRQVFLWENGNLERLYLDKENSISREEYLYIHFFCRPMRNSVAVMDRILIYPDAYRNFYKAITPTMVRQYGRKSKLAYYIRVFKQNKHRLSIRKIISYFQIKVMYEARKKN